MKNSLSIFPVVLAGGSGTRLWPVSRESYPKQFVKLFDKYVQSTVKYNTKANIHNNNYEQTIISKKKTILLEYEKHCDRFIKLIDYFRNCSNSIMQQINSSEFLKFFLTEKTT